jgi:drug/metabolite transporter (DMT)-like permease
MPLMATHIYADGVNAMTLVFLRNFLALPSLALLAYIESKTLKIKIKPFFSISILSFLGCTLTPILLFSSYNYIPSGTATIFHFVYPTLVVIIGLVFLKRKMEKATLISIAFCLVGIAVFYNPQDTFHFGGAGLALMSGVTFAIYVVLLSKFENLENMGFLFSFYVALWSSIITFILCVSTNSLLLPQSFNGWLLCALFALLVTTGAVVLFQQGTFIIGGERSAILSTLEPITGVVVGIWLLGEKCKLNIILGSVLVLAASVIITISDIKNQR